MPEILDQKTSGLIGQVLAVAEPAAAAALRERTAAIRGIADLVGKLPSLREPGKAGLLIEHLCQADRYAGDLALPAKACFAHAFLAAKVDLLKELRSAVPPDRREVVRALRAEVGRAVYNLLAEELVRSLVHDRGVGVELRRRAAGLLVDLWDEGAPAEMERLCPVLELVWDARARAGCSFGTLLGTAEYFQLVHQRCPETVLDFFSRNEVPEEESQAFQEFLLGLPWDDVLRLQAKMKGEGRSVINSDYALSHLTLPPTQLRGDPEALYASFRRRMHHTELRKTLHQPGPTRTAEAYLLVHMLKQAARLGTRPA